jgi:hypothetical protein
MSRVIFSEVLGTKLMSPITNMYEGVEILYISLCILNFDIK